MRDGNHRAPPGPQRETDHRQRHLLSHDRNRQGEGRAQRVDNVRFDHATLFDEDLEKGSFDVVMGFNFLHLLEDIPGAVRRVNELLKPGGLVHLEDVCLAEQSRLWSVLLAVMKLLGFAPYVKCLKVAELEDIITSADFEIVETGFYPPSPPSRYIVARKS